MPANQYTNSKHIHVYALKFADDQVVLAQDKESYKCFKFNLVARKYQKNGKLYIYQTVIQSILVYGAEVWQIPTR